VPSDPAARSFSALYACFNARDIDGVLARLAPDVRWPNGWEGGYVIGHDAVRDYWTRQWAQIDPIVTPRAVSTLPDGRVDVEVHQAIRDTAGALLDERIVHHVYRLRGEQIQHMQIRE
jgi:ketosteroid isomerase-like protein